MCCLIDKVADEMKKTYLLPFLGLLNASAIAEEPKVSARLVESYISAEAIERTPPEFPKRALKRRSDGWVQLSYVIDKEGKVKDIVPVDYGGDKAFISAAMKAVKKWKFEPAMADGEPIEQCDNAIQLDFVISNGAGVSRRFNSAMFSGRTALSEGDLDKVRDALNKMDTAKSINITEIFWRNHLAISLYNKTGELDKKHDAVVQARSSLNAVSLDDDQKARLRSYLLQEEFAYLVNHRFYSSALFTFDKLKEANPDEASVYEDAVLRVKSLIASEEPIVVPVEIDDSGRWHHYLARRAFTFAEVEGRLDKVEIRCSRTFRSFTISDKSQWQIPASWGQCNIHVLGEQNSKFKLVELKA